jgi:Kdo2-lipid IVA lauroyltransferase/acyltransferase
LSTGATNELPSPAPRPSPPTFLDRLEYVGLLLFLNLLGALPRPLALRCGAALGSLAYLVASRPRRIARRNLAIAFPEKGERERNEILRRSCRNLGRMAAEFCHLRDLTPETIGRYVQVDDPALWQAALDRAATRGAVILTGHFGNWELLAYAHGMLGHPITLVHRPMRNRLVDELITSLRSRAGTRSIAKKSAAKAAIRALRGREIVAIPSDQNQTRRYGIFVDFFGLAASTTPGPARLAMLTGAPILPVFLVREGESDRHRIIVLPDVEPASSGDREADILTTTQRCARVMEDMLRRYPEQWIWFHKRWRTRPPGEPGVY